jgi:HPt (histidine-containing phosphotransfer) domain-containing protein
VRGNKVNLATPPDVLNITELLNRVDNDREPVSELFLIFKSMFPSHLQRLSDAVAKELPNQIEAESHTLKGMQLNLNRRPERWRAADIEDLGREAKIVAMREALTGFQSEAALASPRLTFPRMRSI